VPIERYVVYGSGGVGASLGAQLHRAGKEVVLISRGEHLRRIQGAGLTYRTPDGTENLRIEAVAHPGDVSLSVDDAVFLAMKTQDSLDALVTLQACAPPELPILCAQNGVENERLALRRFRHVYGLSVWIPATFTEPGIVSNFAPAAPIELGRIPSGGDERGEGFVADLNAAGFDAKLRESVLGWKYAKLVTNIQATLDAVCGGREGLEDVCEQLRSEAEDCYRAAGILLPSHEEHLGRLRSAALAMATIDGEQRTKGSSSQSLSRGLGSIETDYINGEITLLGRLHGVRTPANLTVQEVANSLAEGGREAALCSGEELRARIRQQRNGGSGAAPR